MISPSTLLKLISNGEAIAAGLNRLAAAIEKTNEPITLKSVVSNFSPPAVAVEPLEYLCKDPRECRHVPHCPELGGEG